MLAIRAGMGVVTAQARIEVELRNLQPVSGTVRVALYEESQFMKKPLRGFAKPVTDQQMILVFDNLPEGDYAISVYHDVNNNGRLDYNVLGIPREPVGFSNDARGRFGPPDFQSAKFNVKGLKRIAITLNRL